MYSSTKLHLGKESLCLLNSWETERKKKNTTCGTEEKYYKCVHGALWFKKNDSINSHGVSHETGAGGKLPLQDPLCVRSIGMLGASPLLFTDPLQSRNPILDSRVTPLLQLGLIYPSLLTTIMPAENNREQVIFAHFNLSAQTIHRSRGNWVPLCAKPSVMCYVYMSSFHFSTINAIIISIFRCGMEACRASVICPNPHNQYIVTPGFKPWCAWLHHSLLSCYTVPAQKKADSNYFVIFFKFKHNPFNNITLVSGVRIKLF